MEYVVVFQVFCGFFAAFVAARKERSVLAWFAIGTLLPVVGVALALRVKRTPARGGKERTVRQAPRRCRGSFIPDCRGCPFFSRPLFDPSQDSSKKGYCQRFERVLVQENGRKGSRVTFED